MSLSSPHPPKKKKTTKKKRHLLLPDPCAKSAWRQPSVRPAGRDRGTDGGGAGGLSATLGTLQHRRIWGQAPRFGLGVVLSPPPRCREPRAGCPRCHPPVSPRATGTRQGAGSRTEGAGPLFPTQWGGRGGWGPAHSSASGQTDTDTDRRMGRCGGETGACGGFNPLGTAASMGSKARGGTGREGRHPRAPLCFDRPAK